MLLSTFGLLVYPDGSTLTMILEIFVHLLRGFHVKCIPHAARSINALGLNIHRQGDDSGAQHTIVTELKCSTGSDFVLSAFVELV